MFDVGSAGGWGWVSHIWEVSVTNDCESCGEMVAVKREPGKRLLEASLFRTWGSEGEEGAELV